MPRTRSFLFCSLLIVAGSWCLYLLLPQARAALTAENHLVEMITAGLCLCGAVVGFRALLAWRGENLWRPYAFIPLLALLGFMEEVSYGRSVGGWRRPIIAGKRIDGLHDFADVLHNLVRFYSAVWLWLLLGILAAAGILMLLRLWRRVSPGWRGALERRPHAFRFLLISFGLMAMSILVDVGIVTFVGANAVEESLEMMAAAGLLFACLALRREPAVPVGSEPEQTAATAAPAEEALLPR